MKQVLLGLLALWIISSCNEKKENETKSPTRVKTEIVSLDGNVEKQEYVGIVEENKATAVSFTGMGVVRQMLVSEGQPVGRGQLIATMDDTQARNMLISAEAQMAQADDALQRYRLLHENGSLPDVQWVEIQSKVTQAKSQLAMAKKNVADCRLTAPVGGIIGHKHVSAGETVLPSQAVVTIFDIHTVKVKVAIPESDMNAITSNTPSTIRIDAAGKIVHGGRIEKGVSADALTHTYDIRIHVANPDRKLLPGMVANVNLRHHANGDAAVTLPLTSVQRRSDGTLFVWTVGKGDAAHRTTVKIGETMGNRVAITDGIVVGQRVVTEGYQKLSEGTKVIY